MLQQEATQSPCCLTTVSSSSSIRDLAQCPGNAIPFGRGSTYLAAYIYIYIYVRRRNFSACGSIRGWQRLIIAHFLELWGAFYQFIHSVFSLSSFVSLMAVRNDPRLAVVMGSINRGHCCVCRSLLTFTASDPIVSCNTCRSSMNHVRTSISPNFKAMCICSSFICCL